MLVLIGVALVVIGFALRINSLVVVVVAAVMGTVLDVVDDVTTEMPLAGPVSGRSRGTTTVASEREVVAGGSG